MMIIMSWRWFAWLWLLKAFELFMLPSILPAYWSSPSRILGRYWWRCGLVCPLFERVSTPSPLFTPYFTRVRYLLVKMWIDSSLFERVSPLHLKLIVFFHWYEPKRVSISFHLLTRVGYLTKILVKMWSWFVLFERVSTPSPLHLTYLYILLVEPTGEYLFFPSFNACWISFWWRC